MSVPRKRPTIKDVAAEAGVGVMTVSYSFNQPARVADETRRRVLAAAERLGYARPNTTARALRFGRTGQLGVVFSEHLSYAFDDPQAALFLAGVADVCVEEGLGMMLIPTHGDDSDVETVLGAAVDGYVLWTTTADDPVLHAVAASGRAAAIQGGPDVDGITCVAQDERSAAAAVATAALEHGGLPAVIGFPLDRRREPTVGQGRDLPDEASFPVTRHRLDGYHDALVTAGIDWATTPIAVTAHNSRADGAAAMEGLLIDLPEDLPLAVLAMSDELALGARQALRAVGREATVTGWDGSAEAQEHGVISVANPLREQGRRCARATLDPSTVQPEVAWEVLPPRHVSPPA